MYILYTILVGVTSTNSMFNFEDRGYVGVEISAHGTNHKEIRMRINAANKCFYALKTVLKSKLVSVNTQSTL